MCLEIWTRIAYPNFETRVTVTSVKCKLLIITFHCELTSHLSHLCIFYRLCNFSLFVYLHYFIACKLALQYHWPLTSCLTDYAIRLYYLLQIVPWITTDFHNGQDISTDERSNVGLLKVLTPRYATFRRFAICRYKYHWRGALVFT